MVHASLHKLLFHFCKPAFIIFADVLSATPRLSELVLMRTPKGEKVEIIESVAVEWRRLGTMLDFDSVGNRLKLIASEERDKPEPCCQSMFQYWLSGKGVQPATWGRLIQMLEDCHFIAVAQKVKEALQIDTGVGMWEHCFPKCNIVCMLVSCSFDPYTPYSCRVC